MIKPLIKNVAKQMVDTSLASYGLRAWESSRTHSNQLRVFALHRVDFPEQHPELYPGVHSGTPHQFERMLIAIERCATFVSLAEVLQSIHSGRKLPKQATLVTFDDAYQSFDDFAWPLMKARGIPATLFVATSFPDQPENRFWWDRLYHAIMHTNIKAIQIENESWSISTIAERSSAAQRLMKKIKRMSHADAMMLVDSVLAELEIESPQNCVISWKRLNQLAQEGVTLAAHSHTHPLLNRQGIDEVREEIRRSRTEIIERTNTTPAAFAYPAGGVTQDVAKVVAEEGFELAFTTERGCNLLESSDFFQLKRFNVSPNTTANVLRLQMLL